MIWSTLRQLIFQWAECIPVNTSFFPLTQIVSHIPDILHRQQQLGVDNGRKASSLWLRLVYETKIPQEDKILIGNEHFQYDSTSPYSRSHYICVRQTLHHPPISLKLGIMTPRMPPNVILMELTYEETYIPLPKQQEFSKTVDN